jgi:hypothetical protein
MCFKRRAAACAFLFSACLWQLSGQTNEGIIAGTVLDPSGAAIEGAQVVAKNEATGSTYTATSEAGGNFRFPSVVIGKYDVTASRTGFNSVTQSGVNVTVSTTTALNITLNVGNAQQTVTVQADATRIETESSDIGTVVTTRQIVELPLALGGVGAMRSPEAFVFLAPGTSGPGTANSNNGIFLSKIGGGQNFGNEVLLDGVSILRTENGSSFDEAAPSVEAIAEFRVLTSTIPATYGRTTGGVENFTIKSGTNNFHGTAYDILQNEDLDANSFFNNANGAPRPINKKNDYGLNLGGPVWIPKVYNGRNKTFFFFNWEQYQQNIGGTATSIVPTAAERNGDFSGVLNTANQIGTSNCPGGGAVFAGEIFDPSVNITGTDGLPCRTPFPNNRIPTSRISRVSQNLLNIYPAPNIPVQKSGINYLLTSNTPLYNTTYTIRIDQSISDKDKLFGTYDSRDNERYVNGNYILPPPLDPNGWNQSFITHYGRAGWDHIFSPTLLNHLVIGYNRTNSVNYTTGALQALAGKYSWPQKLGISGINGANFPIINIGEGTPAVSRANADDNLDNGERLNDIVTWVKGKHNLTFGFDFRNQLFGNYATDNATGTYNFARAETAVNQNFSGTSGNSIASFLLGAVDNANAAVQAHAPRWTSQYYAAFIQDDWKATTHLTLNLGLRYDIDVPRIESYNNTSNFNPVLPNPAANNILGALQFANICRNCNPRWADTKYHDVGPRIGFAYNPNGGRVVLRGGYGILYGPLQYTDFGGNQLQGYTATPTFTSSNGFNPAFNWDNGFPAFQPAPITDPSLVNGGNPNYIQPRFGQPAIIQNWSFQIQGQVSKNTVATLGYVGQRGQNLRSALMNINNIPQQDFALGSLLNQQLSTNTGGINAPYANFFTTWGNTVSVQHALRPFPQYGFIQMDTLQNIGQSTYNSLQATLERRFSNGLSLQASFTWAKILTDADSILPGINGGVQQIQNPGDLRNEKSVSSQDVPYAFTAAPLYELPFGKGKRFLNHGIAGAIFGGFQIGAVLRYQTGVPISFGCAQGIPGWDNCIRFNQVPGVTSPFSSSVLNGTFNPLGDTYFAPACRYAGQAGCAFADPNNLAVNQGSKVTVQQARGFYAFGNYPRNTPYARAPNYFNEDFSAIRNFYFTESVFLQLKAEFLNAFNRHIFSIPNANPNDANFGVVNGTINSPRVVQFTLRMSF